MAIPIPLLELEWELARKSNCAAAQLTAALLSVGVQKLMRSSEAEKMETESEAREREDGVSDDEMASRWLDTSAAD